MISRLITQLSTLLCILLFLIVIFLLFNIDLVKYPIVQYFSPYCVPPQRISENAGSLTVLDTRKNGSGDTFVVSEPTEWANGQLEELRLLQAGEEDLVVYIHGFRTNLESATCVAESIRADISDLKQFKGKSAPDLVLFVWPGEFEPTDFDSGQKNAIRAARYLVAMLSALRQRRIILVAHSLGAQVAMEVASRIPSGPDKRAIRAIVLVQGAIQVTSVRTWTQKTTIRFPTYSKWVSFDLAQSRLPIVTTKSGTGCYVHAADNTMNLIVTKSRDDITLSRWYFTDQYYGPGPCPVPKVYYPSLFSDIPLPQHAAIGSGMLKDDFCYSDREIEAYNSFVHENRLVHSPTYSAESRYIVPLPNWEGTYCSKFKVPHAAYHEIRLVELAGWRPYFDWHSPLNSSAMRRDFLGRVWDILEPIPSPKKRVAN